jgi:hypothetical protein
MSRPHMSLASCGSLQAEAGENVMKVANDHACSRRHPSNDGNSRWAQRDVRTSNRC